MRRHPGGFFYGFFMSLLGELQQLDGGRWFEGFELDARNIGGTQEFFTNGSNEFSQGVIWQGVTYQPWPIEASGFGLDGSKPTRPTIAVANVTGAITALMEGLDNLVGAWVIRRRTKLKYLDAANFVGGNAEADADVHLPDERYMITQKTQDDGDVVSWELGPPTDMQGKLLPARQVLVVCTFKYRGDECPYAGGAVADALDNPTSDLALDRCSHKVSGCKLRFGANATLPFGGFPGAGLTR